MLEVADVARVFGRLLDREQPEVCHFQHLVKLGIGLVEEARSRGIATLYTAHDYYAVCHRYTLLRPDLSHCDTRGDSMACACCDLALGHLNARVGLGDYQMGVFRDQLKTEDWQRLENILEGDPGASGIGSEELDLAFDLRSDLDARRARAFDAMDRIIAPTQFLSDELVRGGIDPRKLEVLPYGIDISDLGDLPPVRNDPEKPLRFAFVGGISKHKGVHLLLEAWRTMKQGARGAELSIWGYSTDAVFHQRIRDAAASMGIHWRGPYERRDLPDVLSATDVVISPSTWVENYPIVIREAFAAGRPVIASRYGALPESIRDGVDGLLFTHNDAADLGRTLKRCLDEPDLVSGLVKGIAPVHDLPSQAGELLERYRTVLNETAARAEPGASAPLPASLKEFDARYRKLTGMPMRQLLRRALSGLKDLSTGLGCDALGITELLTSLGEGMRTQDWMRDARQEIEWLRDKLKEEGELRGKLEHTFALLERDSLDLEMGKILQEETLRSADDYVVEKESELSLAGKQLRQAERYSRAKESDLKAAESQLEEVAQYISDKEAEMDDAQNELARLRSYAAQKEQDIDGVEAALREAGAYARTKEVELSKTEERLGKAGSHIRSQEHALEEHRAKSVRAGEHLEHQQSVLAEQEEALRAADVRLQKQERSMVHGQKELDKAVENLRTAGAELRRAEAARDSALEVIELKKGELQTKESLLRERGAALEEATRETEEGGRRLRSAAELGLQALETQRRLLFQTVRPLYESVCLAAAPDSEPELPQPGLPFRQLIGAMLAAQENAEHLFQELEWSRRIIQDQIEELGWRRTEMEEFHSLMERFVLARVVALARSRQRVLDWKKQEDRFNYEAGNAGKGVE
jgi:hypothetical protein